MSAAFARANDAEDALKQAQKAMNETAAYRMTSQSTNLDTGKDGTTTTLEYVAAGALHRRFVSGNGVVYQTFIDGKRGCVSSDENGHYIELEEEQRLSQLEQQSGWLGLLLAQAENLKLAGHEEVKSAPTSVYTLDVSLSETTDNLEPVVNFEG